MELNTYIVNLLNQSFYQNKVDILEKKLHNKKEDTKTKEHVKSETKCHFYNKGYCRSKALCSFVHPKIHCDKENCKELKCPHRHIKTCKNFLKSSCKFGNACEYKHDSKKKKDELNSTAKTDDKTKNDESLKEDLDNLDIEDTNDTDPLIVSEDLDKTFACDNCENTETSGEKLKEHVESNHERKHMNNSFTCNKCHFTLQSKRSFNNHVKSCHEDAKLNEVNTKKRKSENDNFPSGKKLK